jgi:hypothetical protein
MVQSNFLEALISHLKDGGLAYGREDSFKLRSEQLLSGRILIGVDCRQAPATNMLALAARLGMPADCITPLLARSANANRVFFGIEHSAGSTLLKVYLEFWDVVREQVRLTGTRAPQLLHLGVKWDSARPAEHDVARYDCYPLLGVRDILRRIALCYADPASPLCALAQALVRQAAQRNRAASLLYLEVSEEGNPRKSFDINLYKAGMLVDDAQAALAAAAAQLRVPAADLARQLQWLGHCPLGHLSSGIDRHGREFLSVYAETIGP